MCSADAYGFRELVTTILAYLTDDNLNYHYDLILNPTGGYKGVIPFVTVLGMLYGKRSVYIFEHAEQLINLPPCHLVLTLIFTIVLCRH